MLSGDIPSSSRNHLLEPNPITPSKFKSFSKEIDRDLSQDYIRRQLYAYGILHTQANKAISPTGINTIATGKRSGNQLRDEFTNDRAGMFTWNQLRTTQVVYQEIEGRLIPSLRAPFSSHTSHKKEADHPSLPRWPREVESIDIPVKFIISSQPLPIKIQTSDPPPDPPPIPLESDVHCVYRYNNCTTKEKCFTKSRIGSSHSTEDIPSRVYEFKENSLKFEARFESGNLRKANQVGEYDYELYLQHDLYTGKYAQWFFFQVRNMTPGVKYRFVIMNLIKPASLYSEGMRPLFYSQKQAASHKTGWLPHGENVFYYKNHNKYRVSDKSTKERSYYSLSWTCDFLHADDTCYFSHCYPYTYSDLQIYLERLHKCPLRSKICRQKLLCTSLAGNMVHLLTITNPSSSPAETRAKRAIVISARVHPGETNSSFMMKGVIDFLTDPESQDANMLRSIFVFKIIPMLNPDGVITGNYRCSLSGCDLNRQYNKFSVMKEYFPVIFHLRQMMRKLCQEREVTVYCDLHGHSRKQNIFMYGCDDRARRQPGTTNYLDHIQTRILPFMLSKNAPHLFSYRYSRFKVQKYKEGCGRIAIWKEFNVMNSFTMEASFCGSNLGKLASCFFRPCDLEEMGHQLCDTFLDYFDPDPYKRQKTLEEIYNLLRQQVIQTLVKQGKPPPPADRDPLEVLDMLDELSIDSESDGGSDSSVSDGTPAQCLVQNKAKRLKKKRKSKRSRNKNKDRKRRIKSRGAHLNIVTTSESKTHDPQVLSLTSRPPASARGKEGLPELRSAKEYSSYGSALNELGRISTQQYPTVKYKNRNGGIPVFSRERVEARKTRDLTAPLSGIHYSMPDIPKIDWEGSAESFTHEFLKNLPVLSRESQERAADKFAAGPRGNNVGRMERFNSVSKVSEDGYQSDCESNASLVRNPSPLYISKVPTTLHTGFTNSYLNQYVNNQKGNSMSQSNEATLHNPVEISQVLWPTSKRISPDNPKSVLFTSFVSEQTFTDKKDSPPPINNTASSLASNKGSNTDSMKPRPPNSKPKSTRLSARHSADKSNIPIKSEPQRDLRKLEDIRRDIDSLFLSKQGPIPSSKLVKSPADILPNTTLKESPQKLVSVSPPDISTAVSPNIPSSTTSVTFPEVSSDLQNHIDNYRATLTTELDRDIKKMCIEIPKEHSHCLLPLSKHTSSPSYIPTTSPTATLSKEKSPISSRVSIGNLSSLSAAPQDGSFSSGQPKHVPLSLREKRISNAVHNIAEMPSERSTEQSAVIMQRSRTRSDSTTQYQANTRLNSINMSYHYSQIDRVKSMSGEVGGRHSVAVVSGYTPHSPVPAHISKLMQSGRNTSIGSPAQTLEQVRLNGTEEQNEIAKSSSKPVYNSLSPTKGKSVSFPICSDTFTKTLVHTQTPLSPRRTPSPSKRTRPN
ncbi:hypothetical protein LOD99_4679 [Oopsacas minuta]|uniref:Peptidase M14 domain-containing protein n=1 Tax=Oopsacas minuta TaxID=111878 RepID=A0AAV7JUG6_9METZ|nr:hypothetical protein LOD99_4679 [Oopsacas minuta]